MRQCGRSSGSKSSQPQIPVPVYSIGISAVSAFLPYAVGAITALLSLMIATSAFAQPAIQYPGVYAFYHPNASLGLESAPPRAPMGAFAAVPRDRGYARGARSYHRHIHR